LTRPLAIDVTPTEQELERIGKRAETLQTRLGELKAPVIIEFSGSPKSGKTTNIDIIDHFFRRSKFKVWAPSEGASKRTPYNLRKDLVAFNAWSLNYAISELLLSYHNVDMPHLVILDRGPFDSLAWMGVLQQDGKLSSEDYNVIRNFALLPKWANVIDRIYLFTCAPEISLERENALKLTERSGLAMNNGMLERLMQQYTNLAQNESAYPVVTVSTDNTTGKDGPKNSAFAIVSDLLECFSNRLDSSK
jgi:thymidylate kinase